MKLPLAETTTSYFAGGKILFTWFLKFNKQVVVDQILFSSFFVLE